MRYLLALMSLIMFAVMPTATWAADGAKLFAKACASCHGEDGAGKPGLAPALKGNKFLAGSEQAALMALIKDGRMGAQKKYKNIPIPMPPQAQLKDDEIKAIITHAKKTFK